MEMTLENRDTGELILLRLGAFSKSIMVSILLISMAMFVRAQSSNVELSVEAQSSISTGDVVPFWIRSNQYGSVPSEGAGGSLIVSSYKNYGAKTPGKLDWGAGFSGRLNFGKKIEFLPIEAFAKARIGAIQVKAGRTKDVMGFNGDSTLTSGNWSVSGNALGIPKIELSIPDYHRLPFFGGLFSIKGSFSHGWLGKQSLRDKLRIGRDSIIGHPPVKTFFHQKSLYVKFGRKDWKFNIQGGLNHQAFWGSEDVYYGSAYDISSFHSYLYVVSGLTFNNNRVPGSKVGNHLGSVDLGAEYEFSSFKMTAYRQFFYDAGALAHLANTRDGLTGLVISNKKPRVSGKSFRWNKLLLEYLYTKNQAGELSSKKTPSGDEDYYNNHIYWKGWSYKGTNLGTPFLTSRPFAKDGLTNSPNDYFINNRVKMYHLGTEVSWMNWTQLFKISFSQNYGTYRTSAIGNSIGSIRDAPINGIFSQTNQISAFFEGNRRLSNSTINLGYVLAYDKGDLLNDSFGMVLKIRKTF